MPKQKKSKSRKKPKKVFKAGAIIKNPRKKIKLIIIVASASILILVLLSLIIGIKVKFVLNDELNIMLNPLDSSFFVKNDLPVKVNLTVKNENFFQCKSVCEYTLTDLRDNSILYYEKEQLKHDQLVEKSFTLEPTGRGSGQTLYNFEAACKNIKTLFCLTDSKTRYKSSTISINYDLTEEEETLKGSLKPQIESFLSKLKEIKEISEQSIILNTRLPDNVADKSDYFKESQNISQELNDLNEKSKTYFSLWNNEDYIFLNSEFSKLKDPSLVELSDRIVNINNEVMDTVRLWNNNRELFSNLLELKPKINQLITDYKENSVNETIDELHNLNRTSQQIYGQYLIIDNSSIDTKAFNNALRLLSDNINLIIKNYEGKNLTLSNETYNETLSGIDNLFMINISSIKEINSSLPNITISFKTLLDPNPPVCCIFGQCKPCCTIDVCEGRKELLPVLFIHGHTFNDENTPEFSMSSFTKIQRKLQEDGFINSGQLDVSLEPRDILEAEWGRSGVPVAVRASYYYISYYDLGVYTITAQKSERIENYALRLNEIINLLKFRTGAEKVNIVAHSMGGLVAREYASIFGYDDVNKLILINTPNKGISEKIEKICSFLGGKKECNDMEEGSIFLNRLNSRKAAEDFEIYNIRSTGCDMDGSFGDGIVSENSSYLDNAENFLIEGKCTDKFNTNLHTKVLDPDEHPETYILLRDILKE